MRPIRKGVLNEKREKKRVRMVDVDDYIVFILVHYLPYFFYICSERLILILVKCNDFVYVRMPLIEWSNIFIKHEVYLCIGKTFFQRAAQCNSQN